MKDKVKNVRRPPSPPISGSACCATCRHWRQPSGKKERVIYGGKVRCTLGWEDKNFWHLENWKDFPITKEDHWCSSHVPNV